MSESPSTTPSDTTPAVADTSLLDIVKSMVVKSRGQANEIVANVLKNRVSVGKVVHEFRKDDATTDATIKAFQEWLENANAAINSETVKVDEYIKANLVQTSNMSDEDYEAEKAKYKVLKTAQSDALKLAKSQPGYSEELFSDVPALLNLSTGKESGVSVGASGIRRPRLDSLTINGAEVFTEKTNEKDGTVSRVYTFSNAATFLTKDSGVKVTASELSGAAFETVGTDNLSDATDISFTFTITDKDDVVHTYDFVVIPENREDNGVTDEEIGQPIE